MFNEDQEIWKTFPEYPSIEVSNLGRVRTKDRIVISSNGRKYHYKGRVLKQHCDRDGYMILSPSIKGKQVTFKVHRIVAICFIPNPYGYPEVNHLDGNPANNTESNLEWCTHEYNIAYREKCGLSAKEAAEVLRKPVFAVNLETSEVFLFKSKHEAARQLGISRGNIYSVINGKCNRTGGFWFCNADGNAIEKVREKFGDKIAEKVEKLMREN